MNPRLTWKRVLQHADSILLFAGALAVAILAQVTQANELSPRFVLVALLGLLSFLALHHLRRDLRLEGLGRILGPLADKLKLFEERGVLDVFPERNEIQPSTMHDIVRGARDVFMQTRYFHVFVDNPRIQNAFSECLRKGGTIRILMYSPEGSHLDVTLDPDVHRASAQAIIRDTLEELSKFKSTLRPEMQKRFQYKVLNGIVIPTWILGTEARLYATVNLDGVRGDQCPTIVCIPAVTTGNDIYSKFRAEFERLWERGLPPN